MELSKLNQTFVEGKKGQLFGMFKIIEKYEPELIREQVNSYAAYNESFFTHYLHNLYDSSYSNEREEAKKERLMELAKKNEEAKEFLSFCESYGYQLNNDTYLNNSETYQYRFIKNNDKETMPDYLVLLKNSVNDDFMLYLTEKLGKDYIVALEKEWNSLPVLYRKGYKKTIEKLTEYGCPGNSDILKVVKEETPELVTFYWEMVEKYNKNTNNPELQQEVQNQAFANDLEWIEEKIKDVSSSKDVSKRPQVEEYLNQRMPLLNSDQQHQIITKLLASKNTTYLSLGFKSVHKNSKSYKDNEKNPLWAHVGTIQNYTLLQSFLDKKLDWETYNEPTGKYYVNEVFSSLTTQKVDLPCNGIGTSNTTNKYRDEQLANFLDDNLSKDFWLKVMPNNTHTWYAESMKRHIKHIEYINKRVFSLNHEGVNLLNNISKIKDDNDLNAIIISPEQMQSIREILDKTYFSCDLKGRTALDYLAKQSALYYPEFHKEKAINNLLTLDILTPKHQQSLLETYLNFGDFKPFQSQAVNNVTKVLYEHMLENSNIDWKTLKLEINDKREKELAQFPTYFEIKARIFMENLNSKVPNKEVVPVKRKI